MAKIKSRKARIIIPVAIILVLLVGAFYIFLLEQSSALSTYLINEKLYADINSLKNYLEDSKANSKTAAVTMAFNANAIKAIKERDTEKLVELFTPMHDLYRINFFTICDDQGVVLARTHEPKHFGDSIANQQNIRDALDGKVSTYFEEGSAVKVSVRTGAPIYDMDGTTLIGVVSTGTRFDTYREVEKLKNNLNTEVTVFFGDARIATTIIRDGKRITGTKLNQEAEAMIKSKQEYIEDADILGEKYKKYYMPLMNPQNEVFATFVLAIPEAGILSKLNRTSRAGIIFSVIGLAVSITLLFIIFRKW